MDNQETHVICPFCGADITLPFKSIDFYMTYNKIKNVPSINIHRSFTLTENNKNMIHWFCEESLHGRPFISKILLTKPYHIALVEMTRLELLDSRLLTTTR
jgi:hypothetical protein